MKNQIEKIEYKGLTIRLCIDDLAESPREDDNLSTIACFHRDYNIGEKHSFTDPAELEKYIRDTRAIALPVYLYDHGNICLSTGGFSCRFDSGQIGMVYVEREKILKCYSVKTISAKLRATVIKVLKSEVETYSAYLSGDVVGYEVETDSGEVIDSCWRFIGDRDYAMTEAKQAADNWIQSDESGRKFAENYGMAEAK